MSADSDEDAFGKIILHFYDLRNLSEPCLNQVSLRLESEGRGSPTGTTETTAVGLPAFSTTCTAWPPTGSMKEHGTHRYSTCKLVGVL